ncbi:ABC transporter substrate-binding protein [[Clostridium] fimetarium]|uniref:Iron complex transport system substrate-binding protein n=1 Tax=[Clostridium] fimetarium TaxID=99656 RepID=A0A1I0RXK1_9FIRM|nr:ABC transporter substrate-binding protein [[Clostridium] fimetarium]SEW46188.1 iron complex transport system substrate-binding protein [[Clostridium] fimetarium]
MKYIKVMAFIILALSIMGCSKNASNNIQTAKTHQVIDMAGRMVDIPVEINQIYSTGQPGVVMLYTLCPDKLLGWCMELSSDEASYINAKYLSLPILGLMQGNNSSANKEEIMERDPDIILMMTIISEESISAANEIQETMGIPVIVADFSLQNICDTYEFLGTILNESERATELSNYCKETIESAKQIASTIKDEDVLKVYYAQGSTGLQTAPKGSSHSEVIDLVGGENVVMLNADTDGRLNINMEQLLRYNPDVIIASYSMGHNDNNGGVFSILTNASYEWQLVKAVKKDMVYATPCLPYNWLDMPPSVNRIIGIKWLGNLLYPAYYQYDIKQETKKFYSLFYQKELSDEKINNLLANALRN